jgi:hypothetical protein
MVRSIMTEIVRCKIIKLYRDRRKTQRQISRYLEILRSYVREVLVSAGFSYGILRRSDLQARRTSSRCCSPALTRYRNRVVRQGEIRDLQLYLDVNDSLYPNGR